jgi:hypothetical protein
MVIGDFAIGVPRTFMFAVSNAEPIIVGNRVKNRSMITIMTRYKYFAEREKILEEAVKNPNISDANIP